MASLTEENRKYESEPVTIYDTVHIPPGTTVGKEIRFSFGADISDGAKFRSLIKLKEHELTRTLLEHPLLCEKLFAPLGLTFPRIWILIEPPTRLVAPSWSQGEPGDLDIICGHIEGERIVLEELNCLQIKIRRLRGGNTRGPTGRSQAHATAKMGFDRTVLVHMLLREPEPVKDGAAPSWNPIQNSCFIDSRKATLGLMKKEFEEANAPYGYVILGWGQAYGKDWNVCGGFTFDLISETPLRPFASDSCVIRDEMRRKVGQLLENNRNAPLTLPIKIVLSQHR
ncbi:MAG TPA: hypothetical protein VHA33_01890 [Candidatus Angelobacter sp.]|nr:hypothetical protein [Candidatus Angelobacter sp.]